MAKTLSLTSSVGEAHVSFVTCSGWPQMCGGLLPPLPGNRIDLIPVLASVLDRLLMMLASGSREFLQNWPLPAPACGTPSRENALWLCVVSGPQGCGWLGRWPRRTSTRWWRIAPRWWIALFLKACQPQFWRWEGNSSLKVNIGNCPYPHFLIYGGGILVKVLHFSKLKAPSSTSLGVQKWLLSSSGDLKNTISFLIFISSCQLQNKMKLPLQHTKYL